MLPVTPLQDILMGVLPLCDAGCIMLTLSGLQGGVGPQEGGLPLHQNQATSKQSVRASVALCRSIHFFFFFFFDLRTASWPKTAPQIVFNAQ